MKNRFAADSYIVSLWLVGVLGSLLIAPKRQDMGIERAETNPGWAIFVLSAIIIGTLIMLLFLKRKPSMIRFMMVIPVFIGSLYFFRAVGDFMGLLGGSYLVVALMVSIAIALLTLTKGKYHMKNLLFLVAFMGISVVLGLTLALEVWVLILAVVGFYDFIAVYKTRHMLNLIVGMKEKAHSVPGFIAPLEEGEEHGFAGLGGGDVVFPASFMVAVKDYCGLTPTLIVFLFGFLGLLVTLWVNLRFGRGVPAIPPIGLGCLVGLAVLLFFPGCS